MAKKRNNAVGPNIKTPPTRRVLAPLLAAGSLVAGLAVATQMFAGAYQYHPRLGVNWMGAYPPWAILGWAKSWYAYDSQPFLKYGGAGAVVASSLLIGVALLSLFSRNSTKTNPFLHGSARWADRSDIRAAGLLPKRRLLKRKARDSNSVYVGSWVDDRQTQHYLKHSGPEHVLVLAPTRSGKGVGLVLPTLLSWTGSAVVTDLKGELWAMTAGWRQKYADNTMLRFEPASMQSACWNPLEEIRLGTDHEIGDAQNLATLLVDPDGKGLETHWQKTAQALLVGLILHKLYLSRATGERAGLADVDALISDPKRNTKNLWNAMASALHVDGQPHAVVAAAAADMINRPEEEAGSVLSTAKSYLALYRDTVVAKNTSRCDFKIADLMNQRKPVSLYIVTEAADKARMRPLVRVLVNMIVRLSATGLTFKDGAPVAHYKNRLLLMLDEFPSLGKLDILQESLAFLAGYGIKCYLICQDLAQLRSREIGYGADESITSNCHIQVAFPPNRMETAEYLSKMTGQTTVTREKVTTSGSRSALFNNHVTITTEETERPLLTVDECMRLPGPKKNDSGAIEQAGDMIVYSAGCPAIYGRQMLYFQDPVFSARARVPAPSSSDRTRGSLKAVKPEAIKA